MIRRRSHRLSPCLAASAALLLGTWLAAALSPAQAQGTAPGSAVTVLRGNPPPAECRQFAQPVIIDGQMVQGFGESCLGPDGAWHVTRSPPGEPVQQGYAAPGAVPYYPGDEAAYPGYGYGGYYAYGYPSWGWYQGAYGYPGWGWWRGRFFGNFGNGFRGRFFFGHFHGFPRFHPFHGPGFPANAVRHR